MSPHRAGAFTIRDAIGALVGFCARSSSKVALDDA
jgi:hypothetical protein